VGCISISDSWCGEQQQPCTSWVLVKSLKPEFLLITYWLTNWLTNKLTNSVQQSASEKPVLTLVQKVPAFYGTINMFTRTRHLYITWARLIQSSHSHPLFLRSIPMPSRLRQVLQVVSLLQLLLPKLYALLLSPIIHQSTYWMVTQRRQPEGHCAGLLSGRMLSTESVDIRLQIG